MIKTGRVQRNRSRDCKFLKELNNETIFLMTDSDACPQSKCKIIPFQSLFKNNCNHCLSETFNVFLL